MSRSLRIVVVSLACTVPAIGSLIYFVYLEDHWTAPWVYSGVKLFTIFWPLIFFRALLPSEDTNLRRLIRLTPRIAAWGIGSGLLVAAAAWLLFESSAGEAFARHAAAIQRKARDLGFDTYYLAFALFLSIVHSAMEELYWRWFVFGSLRALTAGPARSTRFAHIVAASAFAAHHLVILAQFFPMEIAFGCAAGVWVGGLMWSVLYARHASLAGAWLSHMVIDLAIMGIGYKLLFPAA